MDEALRDLIVLFLIVAVLYVGAVEYVYWRFGIDQMYEALKGIHGGVFSTAAQVEYMRRDCASRRAA